MTDDLKSLLHDHADAADLAALDLDDLLSRGDRVVRRRRAGVVGGLVALAVVATAAVTQLGGSSSAGPEPAVPLPPSSVVNTAADRPAVPVWVVGENLAVGDRTFRLGRPALSMVLTGAGEAFRSYADELWAVSEGQEPRRLDGAVGQPVSDQDGVLVAWVQSTLEGPILPGELRVADLRTDEVRRYPLDAARDLEVLDLEGDTAYLLIDDRVVALDLASGRQDPLPADVTTLVDAEADVQVLSLARPGGDWSLVARRASGDVELGGPGGLAEGGVLSPDGRWYADSDGFTDRPVVVDTTTGRTTELDLGAARTGYLDEAVSWLDADTVTVVVVPEGKKHDSLLTCEVPGGECQVAVEDTFDIGPVRSGDAKDYPGGGF